MRYIIPTLTLLLASCAAQQESVVAPERTPEHADFEPNPTDYRLGVVAVTAEDANGETALLGVDSPVGIGLQFAKQSIANEDLYWWGDINIAVAEGSYAGVDVQGRRLAVSGGAEYRFKQKENPGAYLFAQAGLGFSKADIETPYGSVSGDGVGPVIGLGGSYTPVDKSVGVFIIFRPIEPTAEINGVDVEMSSVFVGLSFLR